MDGIQSVTMFVLASLADGDKVYLKISATGPAAHDPDAIMKALARADRVIRTNAGTHIASFRILTMDEYEAGVRSCPGSSTERIV